MARVFISYSWKDKAFARKFAEELEKAGVDVWLDDFGLRVGDSLMSRISGAIRQSEYVAIILSSASVSSHWVEHELKLAMNQEIAENKIKVLPVLIEKCTIPDYLVDKVHADFTDPKTFAKAFRRFLESISPRAANTYDSYSESNPVEHPPSPPRLTDVQLAKIGVRVTTRALETFEDILITDVDKSRAYRPDPDKQLYNIYFRLSARPPQEWVEIFTAERKFPRHNMWRQAWIEDEYIVIHCCLDEIKKYHFDDVTLDVCNANQKYRDYLLQQVNIAGANHLRIEGEKNKINDALDGLEFS